MSLAAQLTPIVKRDAATKFARAVSRTTDRLDRTVPVKTGALRRSRRVRISSGSTLLSAEIVYPLDYGGFLDEGVRPHVIRARRAKVLRFRVGGKVLFRRQVFHPGTKKHMGWWSRPTSAPDWRLTLQQVFGGN